MTEDIDKLSAMQEQLKDLLDKKQPEIEIERSEDQTKTSLSPIVAFTSSSNIPSSIPQYVMNTILTFLHVDSEQELKNRQIVFDHKTLMQFIDIISASVVIATSPVLQAQQDPEVPDLKPLVDYESIVKEKEQEVVMLQLKLADWKKEHDGVQEDFKKYKNEVLEERKVLQQEQLDNLKRLKEQIKDLETSNEAIVIERTIDNGAQIQESEECSELEKKVEQLEETLKKTKIEHKEYLKECDTRVNNHIERIESTHRAEIEVINEKNKILTEQIDELKARIGDKKPVVDFNGEENEEEQVDTEEKNVVSTVLNKLTDFKPENEKSLELARSSSMFIRREDIPSNVRITTLEEEVEELREKIVKKQTQINEITANFDRLVKGTRQYSKSVKNLFNKA
ncbi:hypothetical protein PCE1_003724 [Barthelona sp. PCE]